MPETRVIGGHEIAAPLSVMHLQELRRLVEQELPKDELLKKIDRDIDHFWAIDGFWRNVTLEPVWD